MTHSPAADKESANPGPAGEVAIIVAALATVPLIILEEQGHGGVWLVAADWAIWGIFAWVLAVGLYRSAARARYLRQHPVDVAVVLLSFPLLPTILALTRLVRVLRVLLVAARVVPALRATLGRSELLYVGSLTTVLGLFAAGALMVLEPDTVGRSFLTALWWAAVTMTTVGYGDISPVTPAGRLAAVVIMAAGLGVIATLSASIAAYFVDQGQDGELRRIDERLQRIERLLERQRGAEHSSGRAERTEGRP